MAISEPISTMGVLDMTEVTEGFALRLRELRKQKNLSQTELGQLAALHYTQSGVLSGAHPDLAAIHSNAWLMRWA